MKKVSYKKCLALMLALLMTLALVACGGSSGSNAGSGAPGGSTTQQPDSSGGSKGSYTFKIANVVADDHPYNMGCRKFKELLEAAAKEAGYDVTLEIYANSALGGERELCESMQMGTLDMGIVPGCITSFYEPLGVFDLPYLFDSLEQAHEVLDGEIGQSLVEDMPSVCGFRMLSYWENGFRNMTNSKRPINTPQDVAGLTMRVPENNVYVEFFAQCGANVVTMSFSELYTALQQKTIDGEENPIALITTNKLYEQQPYVSMTEHFYGAAEVCFSETIWQTLPADLQQIIIDTIAQARDYERQCCVDMNSTYVAEIEDYGVKINEVDKSAFQTAADATYAKFNDKYGAIVAQIKG